MRYDFDVNNLSHSMKTERSFRVLMKMTTCNYTRNRSYMNLTLLMITVSVNEGGNFMKNWRGNLSCYVEFVNCKKILLKKYCMLLIWLLGVGKISFPFSTTTLEWEAKSTMVLWKRSKTDKVAAIYRTKSGGLKSKKRRETNIKEPWNHWKRNK